MESYLPVCFLTLAVSLPLGLKPDKKGPGHNKSQWTLFAPNIYRTV